MVIGQHPSLVASPELIVEHLEEGGINIGAGSSVVLIANHHVLFVASGYSCPSVNLRARREKLYGCVECQSIELSAAQGVNLVGILEILAHAELRLGIRHQQNDKAQRKRKSECLDAGI